MKQIIDNLLYDTDVSEKIASIDAIEKGLASSTTDFKYWVETLYKTPKNRYFLHGEGGPMTAYAEPCGDNAYTGGETIVILNAVEARDWAIENLSPDIVVNYFGAIEEA